MAFVKEEGRTRRHARVRIKISGTPERPRLSIYRSLKHIHVQLVDDLNGKTLVSATTVAGELKGSKANKEGAKKLGELLGSKALEKGIKKIVFDRSGYQYHGRIQVLAEALREKGLNF